MRRILSFVLVFSMIMALMPISTFAEGKVIFSETFEKGVDNWTYGNDYAMENIDITKDTASEGKYSALLVDDSDSMSPALKSPIYEMTAGKTYNISADFKHVEGSYLKVFFRFLDEGGKVITGSSSFGSEKKEWNNVSVKVLAPEGTVNGQVWLAGSNVAMGKTYIDNVKVVEVTDEKEIIKPAKTKTNIYDITLPFSESFEGEKPYFAPWGGDKNPSGQEVSESYASDGKKSVKIVDDALEIASGIQFLNFPVTAGKAYLLTADMYRVSGKFNMYLRYYGEDGKQLFSTQITASPEKEWAPLRLAAIAPEGAVKGSALFVTSGAAVGIEGYVDNVKIEESKKYEKELNFNAPEQVPAVDAELAKPVDGKLVYKEYNEKGDKIGDYSYAGFMAGDYQLPESKNLPVALEVSPTGTNDDTEMLQNAINSVFNESDDRSMKVIKLKAGTYYINKKGINLRSGIVLSGEGQGPTGTILYAKDAVNHTVIRIAGSSPAVQSGNFYITDNYVKSGSKAIHLSASDIGNFSVGDTIVIYHPSDDRWNEAIKMKNIVSYTGLNTSWDFGETDFFSERKITAINGTEITLDYGLYIPYNKELTDPYIYKIDDSQRLENAGIENLRIDSYYAAPDDENHAGILIGIEYAKNVFIRNVTGKHFIYSMVQLGKRAKQVTIQNCSAIEPVSKITGSRRYSFAVSRYAEQGLYTGNFSSDGRHDFETSYQATGPIVFQDNVAFNSSNGSETHGGWTTGVLYDNVYQVGHLTKGYLALANRGGFGGEGYSHGWASAGSVMWNCVANAIIVHKPESDYQNFAVGVWGVYDESLSIDLKKQTMSTHREYYRTTKHMKALDSHFETNDSTPVVGDSYKESVTGAVNPRSLFKAQLSERYTGSISNARPNAPILIDPVCDSKQDSYNVKMFGIYQLGATGVKIYIDDVAYDAALNKEDNTFSLEKALEEGVHKIYATQIIDGVESNKNADRFVTVIKEKGNPSYLQSIYEKEKTSLLINDPRASYDVINKTSMDSSSDKIKIIVDGAKIEPDVDPVEQNGRTLVPMRAILEALSATVTWDDATQTATAVSLTGGTTIKITSDSATAYVNDAPYTLDVPAQILNGRFVVPVRFISESFGCKVGWIDEKKMVTVESSDNKVGTKNAQWSHASNEQRTGDLALDNDMTTRWAGDGKGVWLSAEFVEKARISAFKTVFSDQDSRSYNFEIHLSLDGVNFTKVYEGKTSSNSDGDMVTLKTPMEAKYFKFVGQGGSNTDWILLYELEFYK